MPQGQAVDVRERQFVVQLKEYFDQERRQGPTVSTQDAVGRVAQALGLGKRTVKEILRTYRQTGQVATAPLDAKGKPPYRIQRALETVIRQRIRELNRQGSHISVRSLAIGSTNITKKCPEPPWGAHSNAWVWSLASHGRRRRYANEMKWSLPGEPISVPNGPIAMPTAVPCVPKCISMRVISMLTMQRHARGTSLKTDHGCTNPQAKARV